MTHHRVSRFGLAVLTVVLLALPMTRAQAQAGAPATSAVQGAWTTQVDAPQWGETPTTIRGLMVKLQAVPRPNGPDAFDVVWLRELLRHPALYHLSDTDQLWMRRTIGAADQAHANHWQPAAAATPMSPAPAAPAVATPVAPAPVVVRQVEPVVPARPAPALIVRTPEPVHTAPPVIAAVQVQPAPVAEASPAPGLSTSWAMALAAVLVSSLIGVWVSRSRPSVPATPDV